MNNKNIIDDDCASYLLLLKPHDLLHDAIISIRKQFNEKFSITALSQSTAIMVVSFSAPLATENKLRQSLWSTAKQIAPFKIDIQDFGSFPAHTIYLHVVTKNAIHQLIHKLKDAQHLMKTPNVKAHFITDPYISIASKLLPWQYEKGSLEYANTNFSGSFIADKLLLLRKQTNDSFYKEIQSFSFVNMKEKTAQHNLLFND